MAKVPEPRRLSKIILVSSLALNVLLVGAIIGTAASFRSAPPRGFDLQLGPLSDVLPRKDRGEIGRELRRTLRDEDIGRQDRAAATANLIGMLEAETFDAQGMTEAIREQQGRQDRIRESALAAFVNHIAGLSLEERRKIATNLKERLDNRPPDR